MIKLTIVNTYRNTETLKLLELFELVRIIQSCEYAQEVRDVRGISLVVDLSRQDDGSVDGAQNYTNRLPRVCFASELEERS